MYRYAARVVRVIDGDTLELEVDLGFKTWRRDKFRLAGYNAPETRGIERDMGDMATDALRDLLTATGDVVIVETKRNPDKYGRWLALLYDSRTGYSLIEQLIERGYGRRYEGGRRQPFDPDNYPIRS